jgi:SPP1 family predicted phage head-tail adaptor
LRHRLVLEAPVRAADGGGGAVVTWVALAEVWAAIEPVTAAERVTADGVSGRASHEITVRHRADIAPAMRFRLAGRILEITGILDIDERRRLLKCFCREEDL